MIKYIHHISDVHIRLLKRHSEYTEVFDRLCNKIKENAENSIIVLTGDIVHSKLEISPELIDVTSKFFTNLAKITKVLIIPGNHDCNLNNTSRLDTLSPIIENLRNKNIIYSKATELIEVDNLQFAHQSIFSEKKDFVKAHELDNDKVKIAMYHGVFSGADFGGYMVKDGEVDAKDFNGFDMVLLGDLHNSQRLQSYNLTEKKPEIWYAGSLIQNNYGEDFKKGYLLWDVEARTPKFIKVENDYGFHTVELIDGNYTIPPEFSKKPRIRLKVSNTTATEVHRVSTDLRKVFDVQELIVNNVDRDAISNKTSKRRGMVDVRNVEVQNRLIREYLESKHGTLDDDLLAKICSINADTNKNLPQNETIRNITWIPKWFEFSNMFSYAEDNIIDFGKLKNVIGLFAPNASGKSSLMDALMFCIFDRSSRAYKGSNVLNSQKLTFHCKFSFEIDGMIFWIERRGYKQKTGNVKVDVDFWTIADDGSNTSLNGNDRDETNQNIRSYIGTYDDFVATAMSFQGNNDSFINKSQTERKDFLAQFLDMNIFDELYTIANEQTRDMTVLLNEYKKQDFSLRLSELESEYEKSLVFSKKYAAEKESLVAIEGKLNEKIVSETQTKIKTTGEFVNVIELSAEKIINLNSIQKISPQIKKLESSIVESKTTAVDLFEKLRHFRDGKIDYVYEEYRDTQKLYSSKHNIFEKEKIEIGHKKGILSDLEKHEYDPNCKYCVNNIFVKNAIKTKSELENDEIEFSKIELELKELSDRLFSLKYVEIDYNKMLDVSRKLEDQKMSALKNETQLNTLQRQTESCESNIKTIEKKIENYESNKASIEANYKIDKRIDEIRNKLSNTLSNKKDLEKKLQECVSKVDVTKNEINKIHGLMINAKDMEQKFKAYELYSKSVSRDGVPYDLIVNTIPNLQEEVNDILDQIVDFNVIFNLDGKNVNAVIAYEDSKYWPIELVSGMEKFISSLAIRCALLNVSNLPRPTFIAIDEGFGVLDSDNINSLGHLFDYLKQKFEFVLIVSHIDTMKDMVDYSLDISKINGFSSINCQ